MKTERRGYSEVSKTLVALGRMLLQATHALQLTTLPEAGEQNQGRSKSYVISEDKSSCRVSSLHTPLDSPLNQLLGRASKRRLGGVVPGSNSGTKRKKKGRGCRRSERNEKKAIGDPIHSVCLRCVLHRASFFFLE
ncbi:MAG: hypothetical protein J3R72DRAFT_448436 [Linnemannia gamsii]|nr:MAG: hypothetical protein J3R72DRAFT_448436 [Linnemannia gamsii]